jgi:hypothetical protein
MGIEVTSGNDFYHQTLDYNSAHKTGNGLDFVITPRPASEGDRNKIDLLLQGFAAGNRNLPISFINEYATPTKAATGNHFHIRIGRDKDKNGLIAKAYKLADQGKLKTYKV